MKFDSGWGSTPDPAGGACNVPPDPLAGYKGASKGREVGDEGHFSPSTSNAPQMLGYRSKCAQYNQSRKSGR